jgi:hypothetical protein
MYFLMCATTAVSSSVAAAAAAKLLGALRRIDFVPADGGRCVASAGQPALLPNHG